MLEILQTRTHLRYTQNMPNPVEEFISVETECENESCLDELKKHFLHNNNQTY